MVVCWLPLVARGLLQHHPTIWLHFHMMFSCVCLGPNLSFHKDMSKIRLGAYPTIVSLQLNCVHLQPIITNYCCCCCCCCCKVASVVSDSVWPCRRQPARLPRPWDSPGKNTGVGCHFFLQCMKVKSEGEVAQLCLTLSDPMDRSLPGSSIHGIFQARVLEWGATAFSLTNCNKDHISK